MESNDVLDDILTEALLEEPDAALPKTSGKDHEVEQDDIPPQRAKRPRKSSGEKNTSGSASGTDRENAISHESENGAKNTVEELNHKVTQLADILNTFAPVVKELKSAYDAAQQQDEADISDGEIAEELPDKSSGSDNREPSEALVDDLVHEVTENEPTAQVLPEKISSVLDSILATGLNEQALIKRKDKVKRPEYCKFLRVTKVNSEICDVARKVTRIMDVRLQKLQEALVKGLTPIARLAGIVGESLGKDSKIQITPLIIYA